MTGDFEANYLAVQSRDSRFDGRLFAAVTSTKIYCRPICPALMPKRANVRFYRYAAVAELAGFRPCRRCRPEVSPDSPEWDTRSDLVGRGLRLIADGVADRHGAADISRRLGVSARHLQRVFKEEIGATPGVIARSRRAKLARQLLAETDLPISLVAHGAGFKSIRAFNETMRQLYKVTPTELRRAQPAPGGVLTLRLTYRAPHAVAPLLDFLARRAVPGVEEATPQSYRRSVRFGGGFAVVELRPGPGDFFELAVAGDAPGPLARLVQQARRLLDLDADPDAIDGHLLESALLAPLVASRPGLRLPGAFDGFELGIRAILGQQVSVAGASTLAGRLAAALGDPLPNPSGAVTTLFPRAERVAGSDLRAVGMPRRRRESVRAFAAAVASGDVVLDGSAEPDLVREQLLRLPGIGPWTTEYIAMRALRDPDAFPASDLGVARALTRLGAAETTPRALAAAWRPWRGYAAMHLWTSLRDTTALVPLLASVASQL